jgi:hypothetical protein
MSQDHAELCSQEVPKSAETNGAFQALLDMTRYRT